MDDKNTNNNSSRSSLEYQIVQDIADIKGTLHFLEVSYKSDKEARIKLQDKLDLKLADIEGRLGKHVEEDKALRKVTATLVAVIVALSTLKWSEFQETFKQIWG